jgi:hypothetical protein
MYYETPPVRRVSMLKFAIALLAAILVTAVPVWFAFKPGAI